jgi:hypothetical protein
MLLKAIQQQKLAALSSNFVTGALLSAALLAGPQLTIAATTPLSALDGAIVEVSEASYPIIKALNAKTFEPFSEKVANLILDINPDELGNAISLGIDVLNSVPAEKLTAFDKELTDAFADLKVDSCTLVPLPPAALATRFQSIAILNVDKFKLLSVDTKWGTELNKLAKTESAICLPSVDALGKLALAQAEVGRAFGAEESARFVAYATPLLKSTISIGKVLPLVNDAKDLALTTATPKERAAFEAAGKKFEILSRQEAARQRALKNGTTPPMIMEEIMAALQKAATDKRAAKREEFKTAEVARIAELEVKSASLMAAKEVHEIRSL